MTAAMVAEIRASAEDIAETEHQLGHVADHVAIMARRVADDIAPTATNDRRSLHQRGELQAQGVRFDTLNTARAERIRTLNTVLRLWRSLPTVAATIPAPPPATPRSARTRRGSTR
jgi:hypothetical protein